MFTCPYTSQQNDIVERKHRHIVRLGLILLARSYIPFTFWTESFATVVYLINILPTPVLANQSPFEKLFHKSPSYSLLRVFGCLCFPHVRDFNKHKFDYRSTPCVFLGYFAVPLGYKCIDRLGRVYTSRYVHFEEVVFFLIAPQAISNISFAPVIHVQVVQL